MALLATHERSFLEVVSKLAYWRKGNRCDQLVRKVYQPAPRCIGPKDLSDDLANGELTAEELLRRYCTLVYARMGSYGETARRLELDRRTVKSGVDLELLKQLQSDWN